ncbi:MAG TPA: glycosyltransferase [Candidatus Dormibacteraeota bacterium]|nr:glycosyltransferase [Candidatus Dormibacteraeota bacterium]
MAEATPIILGRDAGKRIAVISMHTSPTAALGDNANGGLNVYVREICSAFSERGIATDIFTRRQSSDDPSIESLAPLSRVVYLPTGEGLDKYELFERVPSFAAGILEFAAREGIEYDLLYSHYWLSGEVACLLRPRLATAWAHIAHTLATVKNRTLAQGARPEPALRVRVEGEIARQADLLIASTHDEAEELARGYGADPERVAVVAPGVDLSMFRPVDHTEARRKVGYRPDERMLLFVGRLERLKGVEVAIRALALLRDRQHDDVRLLILGEDSSDGKESEKDRLKAVASAMGVRDRVDFVGSVAHHELPFFYAAADVCVMPSYSESFGLVALEAQACGCPVVGSDVSGLRSVVRDEISGYLIDGPDVALYAERIGRILANPELARQMGRRGSLLAQRFSWSRTADRLEKLFDGEIDRRHVRVQAGVRHE